MSRPLADDCVIPRAKVQVRTQVSYGNITVFSHLKNNENHNK